jgi:hypothetical protein
VEVKSYYVGYLELANGKSLHKKIVLNFAEFCPIHAEEHIKHKSEIDELDVVILSVFELPIFDPHANRVRLERSIKVV